MLKIFLFSNSIFYFKNQLLTSKIDFLDNSETWQTLLLLNLHIFIIFERLYFLKVMKMKSVRKRHFQLSESTDFRYRKWILKAENFKLLKCFAKSLCGLMKEIYTFSNFLITRTIDITNRQVKIFYPCTP